MNKITQQEILHKIPNGDSFFWYWCVSCEHIPKKNTKIYYKTTKYKWSKKLKMKIYCCNWCFKYQWCGID